MSKIIKVKARQVFDSRGNPTIEAEVFTKNNSALAICPSGASTGTYEAFEKRDKNNMRYLGKSVFNAINIINSKISKKLKGHNIHNQERIDALMINLDGTRQKTNSHCIRKAFCSIWSNHKFLNSQSIISMYSSINYIHQWIW